MNMEKKLAQLSLLYGLYVAFVLGDCLRARNHYNAVIVILLSLGATLVMLVLIWKIGSSGGKTI